MDKVNKLHGKFNELKKERNRLKKILDEETEEESVKKPKNNDLPYG